jgi:hypothetical protein
MPVDDPLFLSVGLIDAVGCHFDRAVRTIGFADPATGATMLVAFIMWHDDFPFEPFEHHELFPVLGVLLCDNGPGTEKVFSGNGHPDQQGPNSPEDVCKVFEKTVHTVKNASP